MINRATFWQLITDYKINIPLVQSGYALGRKNEAERRNDFLNSIHKHLTQNNNLHLDFIYGRVEGDTFTPINGQQRLTTLFLLHWYLSVKENIHIEERMLLHRFEYDSRNSSREFCHALVNNEFDMPSQLQENDFATTIRNKYWYKNSWNDDPTIQSMLVMMDGIHQKFHLTKGVSLWDCLTQEDNISFDLYDLGKKGYMLTDQLYIKMNARGRQLTQFENFKPYFIKFLDKHYKDKKILHPKMGEVSFANYFSYKIEQEWADVFWLMRDDKNTIDYNFSAYLKHITQLLFDKNQQDANPQDFVNTFAQYIQVYSHKDNLMFLFNSLNNLHDLVINQGKVDKGSIEEFINSLNNKVSLLDIVQETSR